MQPLERAITELRDVGSDVRAVRLAADLRIGNPPLMQDVGERVVAALGEPAARELPAMLEQDR